MTTCTNCGANADYLSAEPYVNPVYYCAACLPVWLRDRASRGELDLPKVEAPVVVAEEAPVKKSKKTTVVEEPVVEEAVVAEPTADETTDAGN